MSNFPTPLQEVIHHNVIKNNKTGGPALDVTLHALAHRLGRAALSVQAHVPRLVAQLGVSQRGDDVTDPVRFHRAGGIADGQLHPLHARVGRGHGLRPGPDLLLDGKPPGRRREAVRCRGQQQVHHRGLRWVGHDPDAGEAVERYEAAYPHAREDPHLVDYVQSIVTDASE